METHREGVLRLVLFLLCARELAESLVELLLRRKLALPRLGDQLLRSIRRLEWFTESAMLPEPADSEEKERNTRLRALGERLLSLLDVVQRGPQLLLVCGGRAGYDLLDLLDLAVAQEATRRDGGGRREGGRRGGTVHS